MNNREYFLAKQYYDDARYPYGFSKSGEFTINEAKILETKGAYFRAIENGELLEPNENEIRISRVLHGELKPANFEEQTWLKYSKSPKRSQIWVMDTKRTEKAESSEDNEIDNIDVIDDIDNLEEDFID